MQGTTTLATYARDTLRGGREYDSYRPKTELIDAIVARLPRARVVVVSADWCKDCRREVPRFARIAERLPDWTVELRDDDDETRTELNIRAIPTFVVRNPETGEELGRIVESPESGSVEGDLLAIAERHPSRITA